MKVPARRLTDGAAEGLLALLDAPLSLWGGFDIQTGRISDAGHPQHGMCLRGRVLAMPAARGSSSAASAIVEAARLGTAPAAILLRVADPILVMGSLVAADLHAVEIPLLVLDASAWSSLQPGRRAVILAGTDHLDVHDHNAPSGRSSE